MSNTLNVHVMIDQFAVDVFGLIDSLETELYKRITSLHLQCYAPDMAAKRVHYFESRDWDKMLHVIYSVPETHDQFVGGV